MAYWRRYGYNLELVVDLGMPIPRSEIFYVLSADLLLAYVEFYYTSKKAPSMRRLSQSCCTSRYLLTKGPCYNPHCC